MAEKDVKTTAKKKETKKGNTDLVLDLQSKNEKLASLKLDHKLGKLKNPNEIKKIRREIAKMKTKMSLESFIAQGDNN